jgi:hypothetical protein
MDLGLYYDPWVGFTKDRVRLTRPIFFFFFFFSRLPHFFSSLFSISLTLSLPLSSHASLSSSMAKALKLATSQGRRTTTHGGSLYLALSPKL